MKASAIKQDGYQIDMGDAVSAKESDWVQACIDAGKDDNYYRTFRSSKPFQRVIEGTPIVGGIWNLRRLLKDAKFFRALPLIQLSDTVGLPLNMIDFTVSSGEKKIQTTHSLSPTTIRYANNALNCSALFGDNIFNGEVEIHEIGSGYGGECKAFNDFAVTLSGSKLGEKWHIYDLPSSRGIIERFLAHFNYSARFDELNSNVSENGADRLVISNGAFSEMRGSLLEAYFDTVIAPSKFGYFITNFEIHSAPHGGWTTPEFIKRLRACGKTDVTILPTTEYLGYFDKQAKSQLIVFGHTKARRDSTTLKDILKIRLISVIIGILGVFRGSFIRS